MLGRRVTHRCGRVLAVTRLHALHTLVGRVARRSGGCLAIRIASTFHASACGRLAHGQRSVLGRATVDRRKLTAAGHAGLRGAADGLARIAAVPALETAHALVGRRVAEACNHASVCPAVDAAVSVANAVTTRHAPHALAARRRAHPGAGPAALRALAVAATRRTLIGHAYRFARVGRALAALHASHALAAARLAHRSPCPAVAAAGAVVVARALRTPEIQAHGRTGRTVLVNPAATQPVHRSRIPSARAPSATRGVREKI
jgi:hypothetical protein